jgi:transposase
VRLVDPGQASALQGRRRRPKTDRLDARWLVGLLADERAPAAWRPPEEIQQLRDSTRLRKALVEERTAWTQRLHALLLQEGYARARSTLLSGQGRAALAKLALPPSSRAYVSRTLRLIEALERELDPLEVELTRFANADPRCQRLMTIYGVGPIIASHLLAELGQAGRFRRPRCVIRLAGLDPVVRDSGERRRRGRLSKAGSPVLRFALVQAAQHAHRSGNPEYRRYLRLRERIGANRAKLVIARRIGLQAYRLLLAEEAAA